MQGRSTQPDFEWALRQEGFNASEERERETLFAIGNGYCGLRGSCNLLIPSSEADLFIAGVYDAKAEGRPYSETEFMSGADRDEPFPELASFPFPFQVRIRVNQQELTPASTQLKSYERVLNARRSLLTEHYEFADENDFKTTVKTLRCASLADPHLLLQEIEVTPVNHSETIEIDTGLIDHEMALRHPHLRVVPAWHEAEVCYMNVLETSASKIRVCMAGRTAIDGHDRGESVCVRAEPGQRIRVRRFVSIFTSRDTEQVVATARSHVMALRWEEFDRYLGDHERRWEDFWKAADIEIENNAVVTRMLRFNSYHLRIAAPVDGRSSIGARTLSGRAYEGHIFWDAELFILPFFLYSQPELARNMLGYRYHTLDGARQRARLLGHGGACYAWESTASGLDATPKTIVLKGTQATVPIFTGFQQIHVTGGVSLGVVRYWRITSDDEWMKSCGAEILFETSRFWISRARHASGVYHIEKVIGPDEYHHSVDDNTYTNWLVRENLKAALFVADWLKNEDPVTWERLQSKLHLNGEEFKAWADMAEHIHIPKPNTQGVYPQFEGFFDLKDVPLKTDEKYRAPFERLLKWSEVNSSKILKQADFLMVPYLFPNAMTAEQLRANFHYYERITDHGSSLSPCIHSAIASRIGEHEFARTYWEAGLGLDLRNLMKNTALGFHAACAGGTWQALIFHILGLDAPFEPEQSGVEMERTFPIAGNVVRLNLTQFGRRVPFQVRNPSPMKDIA